MEGFHSDLFTGRLTGSQIVIEVMCTHFIYCLCNFMLFQLAHFLQKVQGSKNRSTSNFQPSAIMSRVDVTFTLCIEKNFYMGLHTGICAFFKCKCANLGDVFEEVVHSCFIYK